MLAMRSIAIKIGVNGVALWVAALVIPGIHLGQDADRLSTRLLSILLVAALFGVINAFIKPVAMLFSLPFIVLTLGLFTIVVNALMLEVTSGLSHALGLDFDVEHFFWDSVLGAVVISLVSIVLNMILPDGKD
jgi:putative membrane protein